ncbi:hypothetical protein [Pyrococcus abyssi]|uniref:Uncharacterized protein n=1 Tax=Pyrococcus abyssi (strain GE5 / Orsay) TaxID=272844 RepID=Q9UYE8_PYRAB|nr:hypothetical protein [Pyrococcus abyssi]CAB50464.1 Hypothetical protein PAB1028 [Pyrococcus abyssi GE5]CCE71014.1 TPA: hypothetical protein PAB1028 [Pyrococcus abyssi GE5]
MNSIVPLIITIAGVSIAIYYAKDIANKVTNRYFELKEKVEESEARIRETRNQVQEKLEEFSREINGFKREIVDIKEDFNSRVAGLEKKIGSIDGEIRDLKGKLAIVERLYEKVKELSERVDSIDPESLREEVRESVKSEVTAELKEEIEEFEEMLEKKKDEELKEFLDLLTLSIDLPPESIRDGLSQAKMGLLSLRDISKVYVLTGKGLDEFNKLRDNLIELLKSVRKLAVIASPEDDVYSEITTVIVGLKRLKLPMEEDGKELPPEKSFIRIHNMIYDLTSRLDKIAERIEGPIPVTPIEKEFYEKLKIQFEELRKLEQQVQELINALGGNIKEEREDKLEEIKKILKDLGVS